MVWIRGTETRRAAFSLVEVMSSLGIVSFGIIALLGLMPAGLKVSRQARETTAETQITQYLSNLTRRASPEILGTLVEPRVFYFDRQGVSVTADSPDLFYTVSLSTNGAQGTALPSANNTYSSANLSTVFVRLKKVSEPSSIRTLALHRVFLGP